MVVKSQSRLGSPITLVGIHTNEGDNPLTLPDWTAEDLAAYLDRANAAGDYKSYHLICDDDSTVRYVPDSAAAWSMLAANSRSLNLCFTGWAKWSRGEWLQHDSMLRRGATEVRGWCLTYGIPRVHLTPAQVGADSSGIIGHWDWTLGKRDGDHTDPGPNFPWDVFLGYVNPAEADDMGIQVFHVSGSDVLPVPVTVGKSSGVVSEAWVSAITQGPGGGRVRYWFQDDERGISDVAHDITFANGHSSRNWAVVPDGTTQIRVEHTFNGRGAVLLEYRPKK